MHKSNISRWRKKLDLPSDMTAADVERLAEAYKKQQRNDGSLRDQKLQREIRRLDLLCEAAGLEVGKARGRLHSNDECEAEWRRVANLIRTHFENLPSAVVPELLTMGLPQSAAPKARAMLDDSIRSVLMGLSRSE
jgi:hypothetical protein